jgi:uncharacterized protein YbaA (DUF1428 family)
MSQYVDGFVLPIAADKVEAYRAMSDKAGAIWKEYGALEYRECVGEDLNIPDMLSFKTIAGAGEAETVIFAFITYNSREHRDEVNAKVMADPRLADTCGGDNMPFDIKKMAYGGFKTIVKH